MIINNEGIGPEQEEYLVSFVFLLGVHKGMQMKQVIDWPLNIPFDYRILEKQAQRFNDDDMEVMIVGDDIQKLQLVAYKRAEYLGRFLNQISDGGLHEKFYVQC